MSDINTLSAIEVIPSGKALGAEVRGIDFAQPVPDVVRDELVKIVRSSLDANKAGSQAPTPTMKKHGKNMKNQWKTMKIE